MFALQVSKSSVSVSVIRPDEVEQEATRRPTSENLICNAQRVQLTRMTTGTGGSACRCWQPTPRQPDSLDLTSLCSLKGLVKLDNLLVGDCNMMAGQRSDKKALFASSASPRPNYTTTVGLLVVEEKLAITGQLADAKSLLEKAMPSSRRCCSFHAM